ncbi:hypothetical protein [Cellvibrio sp. OA-2007]|uniref:hypothetical protein n=1 Tax=Cellvibrio sp. OA-2007 TaxID=529823 RepID=UPI0007848F6E|nr:hypothetical protein [Cellvibrio sp. OA-2007]
MLVPVYKGRSAEEILSDHVYFDSAGYFYRAMSWIDYYHRNRTFTSIIYACADARLGTEHLMFEELVLLTDAKLSEEAYKKCTRETNKFLKMIKTLNPDHEKLNLFTKALIELEPDAPKLIFWDLSEMSKYWGKYSHYLHWFGSQDRTTGEKVWVEDAVREVSEITQKIWVKMTSGSRGVMPISDMTQETQAIWEDFKNEKINYSDIKIRLQY